MSEFIANPHALIKNNICTAVVFMQDYGPEQIQETLAKYDYDEVVRWEDYGHPIYIGFHKWEGKYVYHRPFPSWKYNSEHNNFEPPIPRPEGGGSDNMPWQWNESSQTWDACDICIDAGLV